MSSGDRDPEVSSGIVIKFTGGLVLRDERLVDDDLWIQGDMVRGSEQRVY
jgi:hypothetical protein